MVHSAKLLLAAAFTGHSCPFATGSPPIEAVGAWLFKNGGSIISAARIAETKAVRGGVATGSIAAHTTAVAVPPEIVLCVSDFSRVIELKSETPFGKTLEMVGRARIFFFKDDPRRSEGV